LLAAIVAIVLSAGCADKEVSKDEQTNNPETYLEEVEYSAQDFFTADSPQGVVYELPNADLPREDRIWHVNAMDGMSFQAKISVKNLEEPLPDITFHFRQGGEARLKNLHLEYLEEKTDPSVREDYDSQKDIMGREGYTLAADDKTGIKQISVAKVDPYTRQGYGGSSEQDWQNRQIILYTPDIKITPEEESQGKTIIVTIYGEY